MTRTAAGLRMRAVGLSPHAARFAGIDVERTLLRVALVERRHRRARGCGEVAGIQHRLTSGVASGLGYTGIVVAMLGGLTMPGVLLAGLLLGDLDVGASSRLADARHPVPDGRRASQGVLLLVTVGLLAVRQRASPAPSAPPDETRAGGPDESSATAHPSRRHRHELDLRPLAATLRTSTPLVYGTIGETYAERAGVLNLGIEGTMYAGAFAGSRRRT